VALRVVAVPAALDALVVPGGEIIRLAPDDALVLGAGALGEVGDAHAIVERDGGWTAWTLDDADVTTVLAPLVHWPLPTSSAVRPVTVAGLVAGVPAVVHRGATGVRLLCPTAFAHELQERLA
jgi:hypothetical protein